MSVGDTLQAASGAGLTLAVGKAGDTLKVYPVESITPELAAEIKAHKADIIKVLREDEETQRTGVIQSERQIFDLAHEYFGLDAQRETT